MYANYTVYIYIFFLITNTVSQVYFRKQLVLYDTMLNENNICEQFILDQFFLRNLKCFLILLLRI